MEGSSFLHFGHFSKDREKSNQKCSQDPPKSSQTEPNMVILALSWPILGATCCQLGPSWAHLGPIFAKNLHQIAPETSRSAPRHPKTTQRVAKGLQDSPWGSIFHGFGVDFGLNFSGFSSSLSFNFSWPPCLKFGTVPAWRAQLLSYEMISSNR